MCVVKNHRPERAHAGKIAVQSSQYSQTLEAVTGSAATLNLWTFPVGYVSTQRQQAAYGREVVIVVIHLSTFGSVVWVMYIRNASRTTLG